MYDKYLCIGECASGTSWVDKAHSTDEAHQEAECSNSGVCDRSTGLCTCFSGFDGLACEKTACPNNCSGHGTCMTIGDLFTIYHQITPEQATSTILNQGAANEAWVDLEAVVSPYSNWDADSIQMCNCDIGYFGPSCSQG